MSSDLHFHMHFLMYITILETIPLTPVSLLVYAQNEHVDKQQTFGVLEIFSQYCLSFERLQNLPALQSKSESVVAPGEMVMK